MKKNIILLITLITFVSQFSNSQIKSGNKFYVGIGTSFSSYIGGDFGSTFAVRYSVYRDNYFYNNNYYNRPFTYNDVHRDNFSFFPLQVDLALGMDAGKLLSFQVESSFLWHLNGKANRNYETGVIGQNDYIDRFDNSELISIPIIASIKLFPFGRKQSSFYLSGGYGIQYVQESVDRIRTVYDNYNYEYNYYNNFYEYPLASYRGREWMQGFKVGMGVTFNINRNLTSEVELRATNFYPSVRDNSSSLSMYRTPNIANISLGTKIFFNL